jgi:uncharacterized protein YbjQ (UPF0145 family)
MDQMILSTTYIIPGYKIVKNLGIVSGITARTRGIGGKFIAGIQSMVGGEVSAFTEEIVKARDESLRRAVDQAKSLGANAIIGIDFETSEVFQTWFLYQQLERPYSLSQSRYHHLPERLTA